VHCVRENGYQILLAVTPAYHVFGCFPADLSAAEMDKWIASLVVFAEKKEGLFAAPLVWDLE
jgi:hypothetical protein